MINFSHSAEARWFSTAVEKKDILLPWFRHGDVLPMAVEGDTAPAGAYVKNEGQRIDHYLCLPCSDNTGVKQRQGRFEIKSLVAGPRPWAGHGLTGRIDQWVKWSFEDKDQDFRAVLADKLNMSGKWTAVAKTRYLQKYSYDGGALALVSPDERPMSGCNVELTFVEVDSIVRNWITLGFEAFGDPGDTSKLLKDTLQDFFSRCGPPPVPLNGHDSLSYPTWLALFR